MSERTLITAAIARLHTQISLLFARTHTFALVEHSLNTHGTIFRCAFTTSEAF